MEPDAELLRRFADNHDQAAFTTLVRRHLDLVYSAALRRSGGRSDLAHDISQRVFCALARKAATLAHHPVLAAWLYRATRFATVDVLRAEHRHCRNREPWESAMSNTPQDEQTPAWDDLQDVLDAALDALKKRDQQLILLRFFRGHSYQEVGAQLSISENTARMGAERALAKLRHQLARRGVTCASALSGTILSGQAVASAPAASIAAIATAASAVTPVPLGLASAILMSKLTAPLTTAIIAAAATAILGTWIAPSATAEIASLRAESERLTDVSTRSADTTSAATVRDEFRAQAALIMAAVETVRSAPGPEGGTASRPSGRHSNRGAATAHDAIMTFTWASDSADITTLSKLIYFEDEGRALALEVLANLPESLRSQYATPEQLYAFFIAADAVLVPPPGADVLETLSPVEIRPGRVSMRRPGANKGRHEMQITSDGWKWVFPTQAVRPFANQVLSSETLLQLQSK